MALLSDFFIATRAELDSLDIGKSPAGSLPAVQARSVEVVKLIQLQCIMDGSAFSDHLDQLGAMRVRSEGDDGPWVFRVPDIVTTTLAASEENRLQQIANAWALTDEWKMDRGRPQDILLLLNNLGSLAKQATVENREMYLWVSS
jgi:hypothetical protein